MIAPAMSVSITGLAAASKRVAASASNIANMRTATGLKLAEVEAAVGTSGTDPEGAPPFTGFKPLRVDQVTAAGGGVRVEAREVEDFFQPVFDPGNPAADPDGMAALPKVDLATDVVDLMRARHAYSAGLATIRAADEMPGALLDEEG